MAFSNEDRNWLEGKFSDVHTRITRSDSLNAKLLNEQSRDLTAMIVQSKDHARELVEKHEDKKHNPVKTLAILSSIAGLGAAFVKGIEWLFSRRPQ